MKSNSYRLKRFVAHSEDYSRIFLKLHNIDLYLVLVPLCGKTRDLLWLADQGCNVIGVEFCTKACTDFFVENKIDYEQVDSVFIAKDKKLKIYCGDFFTCPIEEKVRQFFFVASRRKTSVWFHIWSGLDSRHSTKSTWSICKTNQITNDRAVFDTNDCSNSRRG